MISPVLTLFSAPKPFTDPHISIIQKNALTSWKHLPNTNVVLLGDEPGLAEVSKELGFAHIKTLPRSPSGAPKMDAMFNIARQASNTPLYCIINADIILFPSFVKHAEKVTSKHERFVLMGQRWDLEVIELIDFSNQWEEKLEQQLKQKGVLHKPTGSDYFLFPSTCYQQIPGFTIGRAGWDNWMIYHARKSGFPAVDCTPEITIIHQNHDYAHLPGAKPHYDHPETLANIDLAGGRIITRFTLFDADKELINGKVVPHRVNRKAMWRAIESWPFLQFGSVRASNYLWKLGKMIGINQ